MLTIFNRESLWIGSDLTRFNAIRDVLERERIPYTYKTRNSGGNLGGHGTARGTLVSMISPIDIMYEYEIFVLRTDLDRARYFINTQ